MIRAVDVDQRLEEDDVWFLKRLLSPSLVIAGPYIIQIITKDKWYTSLDLWTDEDTKEGEIINLLRHHGYTGPITNQDPSKIPHLRGIKKLWKYQRPGQVDIQVHIAKQDVIASLETLDIAAERAWYDGSSVQAMPGASPDKKTFVTSESMPYYSLLDMPHLLKRVHQYARKGFVFDWTRVAPIIRQKIEDDGVHVGDFIQNWNIIVASYERITDTQSTTPVFYCDGATVLFLDDSRGEILWEWETSCGGLQTEAPAFYQRGYPVALGTARAWAVTDTSALPETCFDVAMYSDASVDEYLDEYPTMVLLTYRHKTYCYDILRMRKIFDVDIGAPDRTGDRFLLSNFWMIKNSVVARNDTHFQEKVIDPFVESFRNIAVKEIKQLRTEIRSHRDENALDVRILNKKLEEWIELAKMTVIYSRNRVWDPVKQALIRYIIRYGLDVPEKIHEATLEIRKPWVQFYRDTTLFYGCSGDIPNTSAPYFRIQLDSSFLVPYDDVRKAVKAYYTDKTLRRFLIMEDMEELRDPSTGTIVETQKILTHTMSHGAATNVAWGSQGRTSYVSADHCQEGSSKKLYRLKIMATRDMVDRFIIERDENKERRIPSRMTTSQRNSLQYFVDNEADMSLPFDAMIESYLRSDYYNPSEWTRDESLRPILRNWLQKHVPPISERSRISGPYVPIDRDMSNEYDPHDEENARRHVINSMYSRYRQNADAEYVASHLDHFLIQMMDTQENVRIRNRIADDWKWLRSEFFER